MKKQILAALALVAMVGCSKENTSNETPAVDPNAPVAATFSAASISRVTDNKWDTGDKIGISMTTKDETAVVYYQNAPYTVSNTDSGTFTADGTVVYFPVSGDDVDIYAYYPQADLNTGTTTINVDVATQVFKDIDIIAAKVTTNKTSPSVSFTGDYAFTHQLSKLNLTINQGDGVADFKSSDDTKLTTTITSQPNTATYDIYAGTITLPNTLVTTNISATTTASDTDAATASAILIPTDGTASSTIVFTTTSDSNVYTWDTSNVKFEQGKEHNYEITLTKTGVVVNSATIAEWGSGIGGNITASDSGTTVAASAVATLSASTAGNTSITVSWTYPSVVTSIAGVRIYYAAGSTPDLATASYVDVDGNTTTSSPIESLTAGTEYHIIVATYNSVGDETYYPTEVTATTSNN